MIADTTAYVISLIKVFSGATILILVLPLLMWHNYLKGKSYTYRFVFCVITQNCFLINLVLLLGFLNICNIYTVMLGIILMFFLVLWSFSDKQYFRKSAARLKVLRQVVYGEKSLSSVRRSIVSLLLKNLKMFFQWPLWKHIIKNFLEYLVLVSAVIYNIWFLTYNVIRYHCYQFSDIPVHQAWIFQLDHGTLFESGIYPFGMHSIVYLIHNIFHLDLREVLLYFGAFQTILLILSLYVLARRIFKWKYVSFLVLILFSFLLNQGRYAASLPQECGMFAVALAAYCLISFLHTPLDKHVIPQDTKFKRFFRINQYFSRRYVKTDVLLFMLAVALSIEYHFFTAIVALILVLSIFLAYLTKMVKKQYWVPIVLAGILGVVIAVGPLMACFAKGIPFQESMQWAISVMTGKEWNGSDTNYKKQLEESLGDTVNQPAKTVIADVVEADTSNTQTLSLLDKLRFYFKALYEFCSNTMFGDELTVILFICVGIGIVCAFILLPFQKTRLVGMAYLSMIIYVVIICTMGAAQTLKIPEIVAAARASTFAEPFLFIVYVIPLDFVFRLLTRYRNKVYLGFLSLLSTGLCIAVVLVIFQRSWVHHFFDANIAYYNEAEYLTRHIRETYDTNTFTVVSTTDEYYEVADHGYHVNISKFINMVNGNETEFKIPTPYVFFFIEKHVLQDYYYGSVDVSPELASKKFVYYASSQDYYFQRAVLESQAYYWALAFIKMYPNSFKVYYEDDLYVAYVLVQNPYHLYNFQIAYLPDKGD